MREVKAVKEAARLIGISIRTAPKSAGVDDIAYKILSDSEKKDIAGEIKRLCRLLQKGRTEDEKRAIELDWHSDAGAVDKSDCLLIVGVKGGNPLGMNCGGCGFKDCKEFLKAIPPKTIHMPGPFCSFKLLDLGIALSSAAKAASGLDIDNRIMYRAGLAGYRLGLLKGYSPIMALPLSASGKNIYFDRVEKSEARLLWRKINPVRNINR